MLSMKRGTQTKLSKELGVPVTTVMGWLNARRNARLASAKRLAKLTNTDVLLWLDGGSAQKRQEAITAWSEKQKEAAGSAHIPSSPSSISKSQLPQLLRPPSPQSSEKLV